MPRHQLTPQELHELRSLASQWGKIIARRAFGDGGPGLDVDVDAMEQVAQAAAAGLTEGTLQTCLEQQAQTLGPQQPCPTCGRQCPSRRETRPLAVRGGRLEQSEPVCHCPDCRRDFFPQRPVLRLDGHGYSPAVLQQIVTAGARLHSFGDAAFALSLTGLSISPRHVQELTGQLGAELAAVRDDKAQKRRQRQLPPAVAATPLVVTVEVDGGRLRTRAAGCGPGVHQAESKEDKLACLVTLHSQEYAEDPQPEPPPSFLQPRRIQRLVRQMEGLAGQAATAEEPATANEPATADEAAAATPPVEASPGLPEAEPWAPRRLMRTCVASLENSRAFGPLMAGEAQARDFYAARRRAFVADGQAYNWTIQRGYFPDFVAIVDFLHVLCYLYSAANAVAAEQSPRWAQYVSWLRACWQGRAAEVVLELQRQQVTVGRPPPGEELAATDPRRVVAEALSYLRNNAGRMNYPEYRRQGLPTTSSLAESLVGEFNARVKGKAKFWNRPGGAEAILQVRAALLSEDGRLERHFASRPGSPYRRRAA